MPAFSKKLQLVLIWKKLSAILSVALIYFLLAKLAFFSSDFAGNVMVIWPASGFALAVVLVYGKWMVLGAGIGSLGFNWHYFFAGAGVSFSGSVAVIVIAFGSMLEFVVAAYLFRRNFPILAPVTLRDAAIFILIAVVSGSIGACFGTLGLVLAQAMDTAHYFSIGFTWWLGDTTGILIVTPPLLIWKWSKSRKGLLFPLIAPCAGLTLIGFFIVHQFEERLSSEKLGPDSASIFSLEKPGDFYNSIKRVWLSWNVLFGGAALTCILGVYLESNRREQMALQESKERLKTQSRALSRLTRSKAISSGDLSMALKMLTETSAATLRVERASIWLFNENRALLDCVDLYELSGNHHSDGLQLTTTDYPSYFKALLDARNIAIDDTDSDPVTGEFRLEYFPKFNISSLLDAPIQLGDDLVGVVCHEHLGPKRHWTLDEQNFAASIADLAALAFEVVKRKEAEDALRITNQDLESKVQARTAELVELNSSLLAEAAERQQTEAVLRESEVRLRLATKAADIGVWDWNILDNTVIFSPEWKRQIGYANHEIADHYLEWENRLHPDDKERVVNANRTYIEGNAAEYGTEFRLRHKDGSYRWIYSRGEVVARTVEGKASRIMGCHVDITELKQAEEALRAFRWFAESSVQGMGMARLNGEVVYMNPALVRALETSGLSPEQSLLLSDYYCKEMEHKLRTEVMPALLATGRWTGELELGIDDGKRIPTLDNFFLVSDEAGQPQYIANIITDMSQQKEVERQLLKAKEAAESADRTKSMFIASMSHELRTPLNAIIGFTGVMLQGLSGPLNERQYDQLSRVARSAKHLLGLITDIIDISKIEAGRIDVVLEKFDLQDAIACAVDTVKEAAREKKLALDMNVPEPVLMHSDRKRLLQCIINLLSNAIKYTEKGNVSVTARSDENTVVIEVKDTGIGIAPEQLERLFIPFERLDSFLRLRTSGTGLGLYLTQKIAVDLLGGKVSVSSGSGVGSCFTLQIAKCLGTA